MQFSILAGPLDPAEVKWLTIMLEKAGLAGTVERSHLSLTDCLPLVLSIGKDGVDAWHEYGLIQVGTHHGLVFTKFHANGKRYTIMPIQHPGTLMQKSLIGWQARDDMVADLHAFANLVAGRMSTPKMQWCAACGKGRPARQRSAEFWVTELDGVGLCDDHYRRRAKFTKKPKPRVEKSSKAAQIPGQGEMVPDGQRVMVAKR